MLAHCRRDQRGLVPRCPQGRCSTLNRDHARERLGHVLERLAPVAPKVCGFLEEAEEDLIAFYHLPSEHWAKLRSTNPLERVNKEIGRRSDVVAIFLKDASVIRLAGALLSEQNDERLVQRRYVSVASMALILAAHRIEDSSPPQRRADKDAVAKQLHLFVQRPAHRTRPQPPTPTTTSSKAYTTTSELTRWASLPRRHTAKLHTAWAAAKTGRQRDGSSVDDAEPPRGPSD